MTNQTEFGPDGSGGFVPGCRHWRLLTPGHPALLVWSEMMNQNSRRKKRPVVRQLSVPITDALESAIESIPERDNFLRRNLLKCAVEEALYAVAEFYEEGGALKFDFERPKLRFKVMQGERRAPAHNAAMAQIDEVLAAAETAASGPNVTAPVE